MDDLMVSACHSSRVYISYDITKPVKVCLICRPKGEQVSLLNSSQTLSGSIQKTRHEQFDFLIQI